MSDVENARQVGLWEQRKLQAMRHIQNVALELFDEYGYRAVTVERVAAKAGVSPSSIYRYFGTKEMLVLYDDLNPQMIDLIRDVGGGAVTSPVALARMARLAIPVMLDTLLTAGDENVIKQRMKYVATEPDVKAGMTRQTEEMEVAIRSVIAGRTNRDVNDLVLRIVSASASWGFHSAIEHWARADFDVPLRAVLERAIDLIVLGIEAQFGALEEPEDQPNTTSHTAM
ncbi:TetR/AcrR family transcriptional regulator [Antrihabitans sp. YC2-6]|uniref:TetR/AcrR family transcriptional regulator n=1 Tax=Antrihabitans sp. YC2-6 TaxID=2799498 RepID=UPI0018F77A65|nr:TetR/AcrR family transcriptional regulator [Antrihabitans sp. YC2-6]MBJ8343767.1 TetR family transcriptional regulator [Antrihabitans sp. YC2-6]